MENSNYKIIYFTDKSFFYIFQSLYERGLFGKFRIDVDPIIFLSKNIVQNVVSTLYEYAVPLNCRDGTISSR